MDTIQICKQCQKPLPQNAPEGLCPECLARVALGSEPAVPGPRVPPAPAALAEQFPQLEILELLGMGGMGMVYKARQPRLDRFVALKILPIASMPDASFAERFEREAKALARLNHPGIVTLHDFGQTREYYYFIMEYVDGMNLRQLIQAKTLEPRQALELVTQICAALQFAHDEQIVHRDIKPENILITKKGQVKIADVGLAKLLGGQPDTALTASQMMMGTLNYMAPEQRENTKEVDHRADIYSLGVVFYEMLTGEVPMGRFDAPSKKVQIDVRLDDVVLHALEREPSRRYQQASEVKSSVETITSSMPKEMAEPGNLETFKPKRLPGFVSFVLKWFAIIAGAWLAVGLCFHWMLGDAQMSMTFKGNVWSWSLGHWAVTFPPSQQVPLYFRILGIAVSLFYLGIAWIVLPAIFILAIIAWLDAIAKCGLKLRQLPPSIRRGNWWWNGAINAGYMVVALTTFHFCLSSANVRRISMREYQNVSDQATEWWFVPNSGAYEKLGFKARFNDYQEPITVNGPSPLPTCTVSLILHRTNAEPAVMKVILPSLRASYRFPATNNWDNIFVLDKDSFATWLQRAGGVDLSAPKLHAEADQIYELLKAFENQPPLTVKEFVNLAKADLRDFWLGGMQSDSFSFGMTDENNGILFVALIGGETLICLTLYFWATRRLYGRALAEIQAGRWTPPAVAPKRFA
jgi:tRNA A-37 threonylcarbamoyl transferase component Bud32